ncbi:MAG: CBS domain-containing protein [Firmicutes bacterium]|nr:CBS domain-containing protein [Bacillota bacterium]
MKLTVGEIMTGELVTVSPDDSVDQAAALMSRFKVGGLPVVDGEQLVGIITSRDVRRSHPNRLVADAMNRKVISVPPECSLWEAKELLDSHGIERLVVAKEGRLVGVVTKSQLYAELAKHVDTLTGLNKAEFLQGKAWELLQEGREIAVIFLDLDDFGMINKEHGHVFGDEVLQKVAQILKGVIGDVDYLCRYAGDEFVILTTRPLEEAKRLAFRMVEALEKVEWPGGVKVTISGGVAGGRRRFTRTGGRGASFRDLLNMASLASTRAKKEKKRVVVAGQVELKERV